MEEHILMQKVEAKSSGNNIFLEHNYSTSSLSSSSSSSSSSASLPFSSGRKRKRSGRKNDEPVKEAEDASVPCGCTEYCRSEQLQGRNIHASLPEFLGREDDQNHTCPVVEGDGVRERPLVNGITQEAYREIYQRVVEKKLKARSSKRMWSLEMGREIKTALFNALYGPSCTDHVLVHHNVDITEEPNPNKQWKRSRRPDHDSEFETYLRSL